MTHIEVLADGRSYVFGPDAPVLIGRAVGASVALKGRTVGRHHVRLLPDANRWRLVDDSSRNGTWVGGVRVTELVVDRPVTAHLGGPASQAVINLRPLPDAGSGAGGPEAVTELIDPVATEILTPDSPREPQSPVLITRFGGEQRLFPVGQTVRVGRDPSFELVTENPLVTRQQHGVITSDPEGAIYTDTSSRGTYLEQRRIKGSIRITESVVLRLGDPATGEELGITPPLTSARMVANQRRRSRRRLATRVVAAAVLAGVAAAASLVAVTRQQGGGGLSVATLNRATAATVRLLMGSSSNFSGWGSGTIVSPAGLILTNAHVAQPRSPGEAVALGVPGSALEPDPPYLTVELTSGQARPVVATYRARPVASDGYLDLAVVKIYATADGQPLDPATLHLPWLPLGDVSKVRLTEPVTVLGFPGVSGSDSITVTSGVISTFVPDAEGHVSDPRFQLETTARVAHGNSGGAAINNQGQLIGVPSLTIPGAGSDISWRLRSVAEAGPLVAAAKADQPYNGHILVDSSPSERLGSVGIGANASDACTGAGVATAVTTSVTVAFNYSDFPNGIDGALDLTLPDGTVVANHLRMLPHFILHQPSGCQAYDLSAASLGVTQLPTGPYLLQVLAGPNLDPVGAQATLLVARGSQS